MHLEVLFLLHFWIIYNGRYYEGLQRCVGLYSANGQYSSDEIDRLESLYASLSKQYTRSSAVKVINYFRCLWLLHKHLCLKCCLRILAALNWTIRELVYLLILNVFQITRCIGKIDLHNAFVNYLFTALLMFSFLEKWFSKYTFLTWLSPIACPCSIFSFKLFKLTEWTVKITK